LTGQFNVGGRSYSEEIVSSPFVWDNGGTNGGAADAGTALTTHQAGHADNNEVITFQTNRPLQGNLQLQMQSTSAWTATVQMLIYFYRIA
jgi:hypothetical protein